MLACVSIADIIITLNVDLVAHPYKLSTLQRVASDCGCEYMPMPLESLLTRNRQVVTKR
jgi:hypothetical protein